MINGRVIALDDPAITGRPTISVTVANALNQQRSISFQATVDTGFTGFLTLKPSIVAQLRLHFIANRRAVLASGAAEAFDVHAGSVVWLGQKRIIPIYSVDSDPLVGMALLWNSRLTMDIVPNGPVTISPLAS